MDPNEYCKGSDIPTAHPRQVVCAAGYGRSSVVE